MTHYDNCFRTFGNRLLDIVGKKDATFQMEVLIGITDYSLITVRIALAVGSSYQDSIPVDP